MSKAEFVEVANLQPIFCTGLANILVDAGNIHFTLYHEQIGADGRRERIIVLRAIMPEANWFALRDTTEFEVASAGHRVPPHSMKIKAF